MSDSKNEQEEKAPEFSVHDRRRVHLDETPAGEPSEAEGPGEKQEPTRQPDRPEEQAPSGEGVRQAADHPSAEEMKSAKDQADAAARAHREAPEVDFNTFILSLASSAVMHLGIAPHPEGGKPEVNLPMAKQVVDMLAMLKEKTKGNLDPDEDRYLEAILYDLRLRFVEASKAAK